MFKAGICGADPKAAFAKIAYKSLPCFAKMLVNTHGVTCVFLLLYKNFAKVFAKGMSSLQAAIMWTVPALCVLPLAKACCKA